MALREMDRLVVQDRAKYILGQMGLHIARIVCEIGVKSTLKMMMLLKTEADIEYINCPKDHCIIIRQLSSATV